MMEEPTLNDVSMELSRLSYYTAAFYKLVISNNL